MKKKLLLLLIVLSLTLENGFALSTNNSSTNSNIKRETLFGYSTNVLNYSLETNYGNADMENSQMGLLLAEKITFISGSDYNLTTALGISLIADAESIIESDYLPTTGFISMDSEYYQDSLNFFIGLERSSSLTEELTSSISLGPNFQYVFENDNENTSYYSFGIETFADICYEISPASSLVFGINITINPFVGGDMVDEIEDGSTDIDYSLSAYSVTPTIGFSFSS